ncbi:MAG: DUF3014 domain-containing protein [Gammaproteobacteria bacterium]|nr:DUF3014 domain-containing protein [Gammaproteobacteria bacterium]
MDMRHWIAIVAIVIAVIAGAMFFSGPDEPPEPRPVPVIPEPPPAPPPPPRPEPQVVVDWEEAEPEPEPEPIVLPPLNESDRFIREQAEVLTDDGSIERVLATDELLRKFVVVVENLAEGNVTRDPVAFMAPRESFSVIRRNDTPYLNPQSYRRYDRLAGVAAALQPSQTVALLRLSEPLLQDAYAELGMQDVDVQDRLRRAVDLLIATPVVTGEVELRQPAVMFEFADPELEALLPAQKQLIRMGPDNQRKVQAKLREIRELL